MRGMNRASKRLRAFGSGMARIGRRVTTFGVALAAVAVGALAVMTRNAFKTIDATAKLAFTLGLATEKLTGYQFAAAISGVSSEQLATAFKRMSKNISDAADAGLSTAIRAFEDLGLSAEELKKISPDKQFKKIADRLAGMGDQAKKVRVALDLFGRSGLGLLKLTQEGAAGIEKLQKEAKKLGLTFTEIDAAKIEAANDAITRARSAIQGLVNQLAIKLAPLVEQLATDLRNWATAGEGAAARVSSAWNKTIAVIEGFRAASLQALADIASLGAKIDLSDFFAGKVGAGGFFTDESAKALRDEAAAAAARMEKLLETAGKVSLGGGGPAGPRGTVLGSPASLGAVTTGRLSQFGSGQRELQAAGGGQLDALNRIASSEEENTRLLRQLVRSPVIVFN